MPAVRSVNRTISEEQRIYIKTKFHTKYTNKRFFQVCLLLVIIKTSNIIKALKLVYKPPGRVWKSSVLPSLNLLSHFWYHRGVSAPFISSANPAST